MKPDMGRNLQIPVPLLYRAARQGVFGRRREFPRGSISDALFVYLDGAPDPDSEAVLRAEYTARPWVCMTASWEDYIRACFPRAATYRRFMMKPADRFLLPESIPLPDVYRIGRMDEAAFCRHPFSHGVNYASWEAFFAEGAGEVAYFEGEIVASASSFLSLDGEVEMDLFTREAHRGKGLAGACAAGMLRDCMDRGITVHWDAQNETSRHLAVKFGFRTEAAYMVYYLADGREDPAE